MVERLRMIKETLINLLKKIISCNTIKWVTKFYLYIINQRQVISYQSESRSFTPVTCRSRSVKLWMTSVLVEIHRVYQYVSLLKELRIRRYQVET